MRGTIKFNATGYGVVFSNSNFFSAHSRNYNENAKCLPTQKLQNKTKGTKNMNSLALYYIFNKWTKDDKKNRWFISYFLRNINDRVGKKFAKYLKYMKRLNIVSNKSFIWYFRSIYTSKTHTHARPSTQLLLCWIYRRVCSRQRVRERERGYKFNHF